MSHGGSSRALHVDLAGGLLLSCVMARAWRPGNLNVRGTGSPSAAIGLRLLDVQPVEKLLSCPFGPERVKDRVLPVLRDDLVFALGL